MARFSLVSVASLGLDNDATYDEIRTTAEKYGFLAPDVQVCELLQCIGSNRRIIDLLKNGEAFYLADSLSGSGHSITIIEACAGGIQAVRKSRNPRDIWSKECKFIFGRI